MPAITLHVMERPSECLSVLCRLFDSCRTLRYKIQMNGKVVESKIVNVHGFARHPQEGIIILWTGKSTQLHIFGLVTADVEKTCFAWQGASGRIHSLTLK